MNYLPNIREKIVTTDSGKQVNPYWQGNLPERNQYILKGYDNSIDYAEDFFSELKLYETELKNVVPTVDLDYDKLNKGELTEAEYSKLTDQTKLVLTLKRCFYNYMELSRNEFGISLMAQPKVEEPAKKS